MKGNVEEHPVRVMFQDEARFGRLSNPRRCWAPASVRPVVGRALVREYVYVYAAVTPKDGKLDWMTSAQMNTASMNAFLGLISRRYPDEYVVMVLDGAASHRSRDLRVPSNMALIRLPSYSPELNPAEKIWDEIREKEFANRVFDSLGAAITQAIWGLKRLELAPSALRSLTYWSWIKQSV